MAEWRVSNSNTPIGIGEHYTLTPNGLTGTVSASEGGSPGARALGGLDPFDPLFAAGGLVHEKSISLVPAPAPAGAWDAPAATVIVDVPNMPGVAALLLAEDESGAVSWIL